MTCTAVLRLMWCWLVIVAGTSMLGQGHGRIEGARTDTDKIDVSKLWIIERLRDTPALVMPVLTKEEFRALTRFAEREEFLGVLRRDKLGEQREDTVTPLFSGTPTPVNVTQLPYMTAGRLFFVKS